MTSVDKRIVQMEFDNSQFDENIEKSTKSIENLDEHLKLNNATKGLKNVNRAVQDLDLKGISSDVNMLKNRFTVFGQVGQAVIARVANSVMDLGVKLVRGVTIAPLTDGLDEYTKKLNSIKTIQTNTLGKSSLKDINSALDELNTYADKTIYNFAEMTKNIGTFTAAGVNLKQSTESIKGIANLAAASGSTSQQAATAMYQLSQAISSGTVKLQDWNSVVNAGMGGKLFQNALKRTAESFGTNVEAMIKKYGSFRESLSKGGWLTTKVLTKTLRNFTLFTEDMTKKQKEQIRVMLKKEGYTKKQIEDIEKEAIAAEQAATKVKTFQQLIDTTKEALGSGWAQTWEIIIGNLKQAEKLWTGVSNVVNGYIEKIDKGRNQTLKAWKELKGRKALLKSFKNIFEGLKSVLHPIFKALKKVFKPLTGKDLADATKKFRKFTKTFKLSKEMSKTVYSIFKNLFKTIKRILKSVTPLVQQVIKTVSPIVKILIRNFAEGAKVAIKWVYKVVKKITNLPKKIDKLGKSIKATFEEPMSKISQGFDNLKKAAENVGEAIRIIFKPLTDVIDAFKGDLSSGINEFISQFDLFNHPALVKLSEVFSPIQTFLSDIASKDYAQMFKDWSEGVLAWSEGLKSAAENSTVIQYLLSMFDGVFGKISGAFSSVSNFMGPILGSIFDGIKGFGSWIKNAFDSISPKVFAGLSSAGDKLKEVFSALAPVAKELATKIFSVLQEVMIKIGDAIKNIDWSKVESVVGNIAESLGKFIDSIIAGESPLEAFKNFISEIASSLMDIGSGALDKLSNVPEMFSDLVGSADSSKLMNFGNALEFVKNSAKGLTDSVSGLGDFIQNNLVTPWGKMTKPLDDVNNEFGNISNSITGTVDNASDKKDQAEKDVKSLGNTWQGFVDGLKQNDIQSLLTLGTVGAVGIFSVKFMRSMSKTAQFTRETAGAIKGSMTTIANLPSQIAGFRKAFETEVKYNAIVKTAAALLMIAGALKLMASIDPANLIISAAILLVFTKALEKFTKSFKEIDSKDVAKSSEMILKFSAAMLVFAVAMKLLGSMSWEEIGKGVITIGSFMGALYLMFTKTNLGKMASNIGTQVMKMSVGLLAIAAAVFILGSIDSNTAEEGISRLTRVFLSLALFFALLKKAKISHMVIELQGFAVALLGMVAAMALMALMPFEKMIQGWFGLTLVLASLAGFSIAMKKFSSGKMAEIGSSLIVLSAALILMSAALKILSTIPIEGLIVSILGMGIALGLLVAAANMLAPVAIPFKIFSSALLMFSASIVVAGIGLMAFAGGLMVLAASLVLVGDQIAGNIETLLAFAGIGALMLPAAVAFAVISAAALVLGVAALSAALGVLVFAGAIKVLNSVGSEGIVDTMHGVAEGFAELITTLGNRSEEISQGFIKIIDSILNVLKEAIPKVALIAVEIIVAITQGLANNVSSLVAAGVSIIVKLLEGLTSGLPQIVGAALNLAFAFVTSLASGIRAHKDEFGSVMIDLISALGEALFATLGQVASFGLDIIGTLVEGMFQAIGLGDIGRVAHEAINSFVDGVGSFFGDLFGWGESAAEEAAKGMESGSDSFGEAAGGFVRSATTEVENNAEEPIEALKSVGEEGTAGFIEGLDLEAAGDATTNFMSTVTDNVGSAKEDVLAQFESIGPEIGNALGGSIDSTALTAGLTTAIGGAIKSGKTEAKKAKDVGKEASKSAGKGASNNKKSAEDGGKSIGQGLVDGIKSKTGAAGSAGFEIGKKALAEAKRAVKAKSPSREFHKLGVNIDEGLILGIKSLMGDVGKSGEALGDKAVESTKNTIKAMSLIMDGIDTTPTIRPVVDLSGIQSGVDAANSIFANRSTMQMSMAGKTSRFYDPNGIYSNQASKQVNNTISINLDYTAGADANQIVRDIAAGLTNLAFMEA